MKDVIQNRLELVRDMYAKDLEALSDEQLINPIGGKARAPIDFTYEVAVVNRRIALRLRGLEPEPMEFKGWMVAPEGERTRKAALRGIYESCDAILEAWADLDESTINEEIQTPNGPTTRLKLAMLAMMHVNYHDAQLNFIQALAGDDDIHWD